MATSKPVSKKPASEVTPSPPQSPANDKSRHLQMVEQQGKSHERLVSDLVAQGISVNAATVVRFLKPEYGDLSLTDMVASLRESGDAINRSDMAAAERMLYAQTIALNAMFGELARVSKANMFTNLDAMDRYMRLALKAQSQARMTVETLAAMKNPPAIFARQANFAAGHQQVNNGDAAKAASRASETRSAPSKLLEAHDVERLDTGAKGSAGRANQKVEAVGKVHRSNKPSR